MFTWLCSILFYVQTPCSENPCKNGATCIPSYSDDTFKCKCAAGFKGKKCDRGKRQIEHGPHLLARLIGFGVFQEQGIRTVREIRRDLHTHWNLHVSGGIHAAALSLHFCEFWAESHFTGAERQILGDQRRSILTSVQAIAQCKQPKLHKKDILIPMFIARGSTAVLNICLTSFVINERTGNAIP